AFAHLKVQLRTRHCAARSDRSDFLSLPDHLPGVNINMVEMRVGRNPVLAVADEDDVPVAFGPRPREDDLAKVSGVDGRAAPGADIDTVIAQAAGLGAVSRDDRSIHGPDEIRAQMRRRRG